MLTVPLTGVLSYTALLVEASAMVGMTIVAPIMPTRAIGFIHFMCPPWDGWWWPDSSGRTAVPMGSATPLG
jgi:hypothetical protein